MGKLIGSLSKPIIDQRGPIGTIVKSLVYGLGAGTTANILDKKLANGRFTAAGINLGQSINGKLITLNGTDALAVVVTNGIRVPTKGSLVSTGLMLLIKKYAEAMDYIDPPTVMDSNNPKATNVTFGRDQRTGLMQQQQYGTMPAYGGMN